MTAALRVLHVEDDELDAEFVRRLTRRVDGGVELSRARDGEEALEYLETATGAERGTGAGTAPGTATRALPHLVLLDLNMPRLDGHGCLAAIRANRAWDALHVAILTTSMREADREAALAGGAADYYVKPLREPALVELLHRVRAPPARSAVR